MSTAVLPTPAPPRPRPSLVAMVELMKVLDRGQSASLDGVSWAEYLWFDRRRDEVRPKAKLTYADGRLEFMTTSFLHDRFSRRLGMCVSVFAEEFGVPVIAGGGTTFRREDLENGLEPDECFYIQSLEAVRFLEDIDLSVHPPPDLAIEVDRTNSSIPKEPICVRLGVPELWRFDDTAVTFRVRQPDGTYQTQAASRSFPAVNSADLSRLVFGHTGLDDVVFIRNVRNWARTLIPQQQ